MKYYMGMYHLACDNSERYEFQDEEKNVIGVSYKDRILHFVKKEKSAHEETCIATYPILDLFIKTGRKELKLKTSHGTDLPITKESIHIIEGYERELIEAIMREWKRIRSLEIL